MLELLVSKNDAECTSRRVKWISGARDLTIFFQQLAGPMFLKLLDFNIVFLTISFRKTSRPMFLKQDGANCFLNRSGPAPTCISAFPVQKCFVGIRYKINKSHGHLPSGHGPKVDMYNVEICRLI